MVLIPISRQHRDATPGRAGGHIINRRIDHAEIYRNSSKKYVVSGKIEVEATDADTANDAVDAMMEDEGSPLQTIDPRISWDEPEYIDDTFETTGDVKNKGDQMSLATRLNAALVVPDIEKGQVIRLSKEMTDPEVIVPLSEFGITEGYLAAHPEGSDRGGYVATVFCGVRESAYYDELACVWITR